MPFERGHQLSVGNRNIRMIDQAMRKIIAQDQLEADRKKVMSRLHRAINAQLDAAADGDLPALDWLTCRLEGKPKGDDSDKSQLIQVVINGYADVQARIVDNSQVHGHEGVGVIGGGGEAVGVVASRVPDDSLPTHEVSKLPIHEISELPIPEISELPTEKVAVDTAPSESDPPV